MMGFNATDFESNDTLTEVIKYFNISVSNLTNQSVETQMKLFDLYEAYRTREKEELMTYRFVAYVIGSLIILSNLTVVISSGLILKKGQQPKSTYLLLGNVSLADTIIGISIIFGALVDNNTSSNPLCIFQIGMLVCPAMVSIFSVGMIAVDRYIYILHGLYYQRWFNTTKVRIGIVCIWMIGITLGFMPATGWVNTELNFSRCYYTGLFPGSLILLNSLLSIVPIIIVAVLYSIILVKALSNVRNIRAATKPAKNETTEPKLRIYRGNTNAKKVNGTYSVKYPPKTNNNKLCRSASFDIKCYDKEVTNLNQVAHESIKSKSINDISNGKNIIISKDYPDDREVGNETPDSQYGSKYSICTVDTACSDVKVSTCDSVAPSPKSTKGSTKFKNQVHKPKEPNKWRAITVVMLTSGSFILTWMPFFITVIFFVFCEEKITNPKCTRLRSMLGGPLATLAFFNSILNPLIYAWWHRGFQRSVKMYYRKYFHKVKFSKDTSMNSSQSR